MSQVISRCTCLNRAIFGNEVARLLNSRGYNSFRRRSNSSCSLHHRTSSQDALRDPKSFLANARLRPRQSKINRINLEPIDFFWGDSSYGKIRLGRALVLNSRGPEMETPFRNRKAKNCDLAEFVCCCYDEEDKATVDLACLDGMKM